MSDRIRIEEGRFHRHGLISWWDQRKLSSATALVLGAGALGNEIIKNLCLLGFGRIRIVDLDHVENSNLSRSPLFRHRHEGMPKAHAAAEGAREIYPDVRVAPMRANILTELGWGHFSDADVVLAGLDGREARMSVSRACIRSGKLFFDGAIESIDGVARVFDGRSGPCFECTMSETDWALVRRRAPCNPLSRDDMLTGHTPTVATISSVIAALQVQQAVKHLHGVGVQTGSGMRFYGESFECWPVLYDRNEECYAHDEGDEIVRMPWTAAQVTVSQVLEEGARRMGSTPTLQLRHDIMTRRTCPSCGFVDEPLRPLSTLGKGAGLCPRCEAPVQWESINQVAPDSPLARRSLAELGIPAYDMVRVRTDAAILDIILDGDRPDDWL